MNSSAGLQPSYVDDVANDELARLLEETAARLDEAEDSVAADQGEWRDPVAWCKSRGWEPTPWQERIILAVYRHRKVCVVGSNQIGKGNLVAWLLFHWLSRPGTRSRPRALFTANTNDQVRDNTGYELREQHRTHAWPGECLVQRLRLPDGAEAMGYTTDEPQALQGKHAPFFLLAIDEGSGPRIDEMWPELKALPGEDGAAVMIGNRNRRSGKFADACKGKMGYHVIRVTAIEAAEYQLEHGKVGGVANWEKIAEWIIELDAGQHIEGLDEWWASSEGNDETRGDLSAKLLKRVRKFAKENGKWRELLDEEGQDWWRVHVLALEPKGALGGWYSTDLLEEARARSPKPAGGVIRVGLDIAGQGEAGDWTDAYARDGYAVERILHARSMDEEEIADTMIEWAEGVAMDRSAQLEYEVRPSSIVEFAVDATGIGSGVATLLANRGYIVDRVHFGNPPKDLDRFANRATEGYYHAAQFLRAGGQLPDITDLQGDLEGVQLEWRKGAQGRKVRALVPKQERKKALGRSPDDGDGFMLTCIPRVEPKSEITSL